MKKFDKIVHVTLHGVNCYKCILCVSYTITFGFNLFGIVLSSYLNLFSQGSIVLIRFQLPKWVYSAYCQIIPSLKWGIRL